MLETDPARETSPRAVLKMGYKPGVHAEFDAAGRMVRVIEGEPARHSSESSSAAAAGDEVRHG